MSTITPPGILLFPHLFKATAMGENDTPKFSCGIAFMTEGEYKSDISGLKKLALECAIERWGDKAVDMIKAKKLRMPFRAGTESDYWPDESIVMNVRTERKPGVVSIYPDPSSGKPMPITDPDEVRYGSLVIASLGVFAYDTNGNKGVSFGLNNLQKLRDTDVLGDSAGTKAEDEFEADADAVADLSDLEEPTEDTPADALDDLF